MMTRLPMRAPGVRILVAGDCMLDAYVAGIAVWHQGTWAVKREELIEAGPGLKALRRRR